jgi:putative tricarboxylic transport membrane protein
MPLAPLALSVTGLSTLVLSWTYGMWSFGAPGAGLMPATASVLLICASAAEIRFVARKSWSFDRRVLAHAAALILLPFASLLLGMLAALAVYVVVILFVIERLPLLKTVIIAGLATGGCWLLFEKLLAVPLPKPLFP